MSDEEMRALGIRECRNFILSTLRAVYPRGFPGLNLYRILLATIPDYIRADCFKDLYYLEEKDYVVRKTRLGVVDKRAEWTEATWSLTWRGNEVANRLIEDPALEV